MGLIGEKSDIDFVISTGDNFYEDGLTGVDDPAFNESFSNIYTAPSLKKQWYNGKLLTYSVNYTTSNNSKQLSILNGILSG